MKTLKEKVQEKDFVKSVLELGKSIKKSIKDRKYKFATGFGTDTAFDVGNSPVYIINNLIPFLGKKLISLGGWQYGSPISLDIKVYDSSIVDIVQREVDKFYNLGFLPKDDIKVIKKF